MWDESESKVWWNHFNGFVCRVARLAGILLQKYKYNTVKYKKYNKNNKNIIKIIKINKYKYK